MTMTNNKLSANWSSVSFTPTGGSAIVLTRVQNMMFDPGGQLTMYSGDIARYDVAGFNLMNKPKASVSSDDLGTIASLTPGTEGILTGTLNNTVNGFASGGFGLVYSMFGKIENQNPHTGAHGTIASGGGATLTGIASDGMTNPMTVTVL